MIETYKERLRNLEDEYTRRSERKRQLEEDKHELTENIAHLKDVNKTYEETRILLQKVASEARESARKRLQETVTDALKYVFGSDFEFIIELRESRGRTEADFYVESTYNGERVKTKPEDARGGGVVDIIGIALRLALVQMFNQPDLKGPIILDEPGKHVSADYSMKLATFLKQMNNAFGRQIIVSTHQPDIANIADDAYQVNIQGGQSVVKQLDIDEGSDNR